MGSGRKRHNRAARMTRRAQPDLDQIHAEYHAAQSRTVARRELLDIDKPGLGQFRCVACARYFVSVNAQRAHERTKAHRRRLKQLHTDVPYTVQEAMQAAGLGAMRTDQHSTVR